MLKIGDKVVIKSWYTMVEQYGMDGDCINVPESFTEEMQIFCGKVGEIVKKRYIDVECYFIYKLRFENIDYDVVSSFYGFSEEMFTPLINSICSKINWNDTFDIKSNSHYRISDDNVLMRLVSGVGKDTWEYVQLKDINVLNDLSLKMEE